MPKYDYRCLDCGAEFEREQRITDDALTVDQHTADVDEVTKTVTICRGRVKRLVSTGTKMDLKGGGWFKGGMQ